MNPEYDAIINQMDVIQPSATDSAYVGLAASATNIFLRDVLEITLAEERHVVTFDNTYWKGWMSAADPYAAPYSLWAATELAILKITPGSGQ
jgi:peptide/nickel transport system substrate-binding protein